VTLILFAERIEGAHGLAATGSVALLACIGLVEDVSTGVHAFIDRREVGTFAGNIELIEVVNVYVNPRDPDLMRASILTSLGIAIFSIVSIARYILRRSEISKIHCE
jgi:hypothetical protein